MNDSDISTDSQNAVSERQLIFRSAFGGCLHFLCLHAIGDRFIISPVIYSFSVVLIAFTLGLSLPRLQGRLPYRPWCVFVLFLLLPATTWAMPLIAPICLHQPGLHSDVCVSDAVQIREIQLKIIQFVILMPVLVAALASWIGMWIRCNEAVEAKHRVPSVLRVFFVFAGIILLLVGVEAIMDQSFTAHARSQNVTVTGVEAQVIGINLVWVGCFLINAACNWAISRALKTMCGRS